MKKIALSICLLALVLLAFTGCGLVQDTITLVNNCDVELTDVTVSNGSESKTMSIPAGQTVTVQLFKGDTITVELRYAYINDANGTQRTVLIDRNTSTKTFTFHYYGN